MRYLYFFVYTNMVMFQVHPEIVVHPVTSPRYRLPGLIITLVQTSRIYIYVFIYIRRGYRNPSRRGQG